MGIMSISIGKTPIEYAPDVVVSVPYGDHVYLYYVRINDTVLVPVSVPYGDHVYLYLGGCYTMKQAIQVSVPYGDHVYLYDC